MSPVSIDDDDDDSSHFPKNSSATTMTAASHISCSGHDESLAGMYYLADCDDESSRLFENDGVAAKRGTGSTAESTTGEDKIDGQTDAIQQKQHHKHPPSLSRTKQLQQVEQEVLAKQQGRYRSSTTNTVVMREKRTTKAPLKSSGPNTERMLRTSDSEFGINEDTRKENKYTTGNVPSALQRIENDLERKIRQNKSIMTQTECCETRPMMLQNDAEVKRSSQSRPFTLSEEISRLDARIAARNSKVRLASKRNVRTTEQDSIDTPIISNVVRNPDTATMAANSWKPEGSTGTVTENDVKLDNDKALDSHKAEAITNSGLYSSLDGGTASCGLLPNGSTHDDLEYGVYDNDGPNSSSKNKGLAVAFAVHDEDEDMYIPSAVEFDPDAKPPTYKNRRFRLYACLAITVVIVGTITASVGITLTQQSQQADAKKMEPSEELPYRATLGIRESIERSVGGEKLDDMNSPYRKALDWIQDVDPLALSPKDDNFLQRYLAVYFFYATSIKHPWSGGCNPPVNDEDEFCLYKRLSSLEPITYTDIPWERWLTKNYECNWAGIYCDDAGQIRSLEFSMYDFRSIPSPLVVITIDNNILTLLLLLLFRFISAF